MLFGLTNHSNWGSGMSNDWGMDGMGNNSLSSMKSVWGISNNSGMRSKGLALGGGSMLTLEGLAHRLVADLSMSISINWLVGTIVDWGNSGRHWGVGNWGSMNSVSNNWGSMGNNWSGMSKWGGMDSMGNWGMSNNWSSMDSMSNNWSGMGNNWSWGISWSWLRSISWGWLVSWSLWVGGSTLIGDISNTSVITI